MNRCCGSTGVVAGETIEGRGLGEEDKGGGQQKAVCTEGCEGRDKGSDTCLQEMLETAGDNEALRGRKLSFLRSTCS